jgi:hypothetical protein
MGVRRPRQYVPVDCIAEKFGNLLPGAFQLDDLLRSSPCHAGSGRSAKQCLGRQQEDEDQGVVTNRLTKYGSCLIAQAAARANQMAVLSSLNACWIGWVQLAQLCTRVK